MKYTYIFTPPAIYWYADSDSIYGVVCMVYVFFVSARSVQDLKFANN